MRFDKNRRVRYGSTYIFSELTTCVLVSKPNTFQMNSCFEFPHKMCAMPFSHQEHPQGREEGR